MDREQLALFQRRCAQYRWLAIAMVAGVGGLLTLVHLVAPVAVWLRDGMPDGIGSRLARSAVYVAPTAFYLFGVWSIGQAMGALAVGRLFQPTLARALRRVGAALGLGGLTSIVVVTNALRMLSHSRGGFLHFDVPGMTLVMVGGALFLLGGVIEQASRVQAELDEMI